MNIFNGLVVDEYVWIYLMVCWLIYIFSPFQVRGRRQHGGSLDSSKIVYVKSRSTCKQNPNEM